MPAILVVEPDIETRDCIARCASPDLRIDFLDCAEQISSNANGAEGYSVLMFGLTTDHEQVPALLERAEQLFQGTPVIVLSPFSPDHKIQEILTNSGHRVLAKPVCVDALSSSIEAAINTDRAQTHSEIHKSCDQADETHEAVTWSERIESMLIRIGSADVPVLLQGETGAGKEVIARKLHSYSSRADGPFVKLNCAALPSELVESELFGYERGAFTGAFKSTPGKFEMAHRGTILLDEIGDMDARLQAKLLQVLQDQEFFRLGAKESSRVDVRVMAASHCDFEKAMHEKRFREDLYYRLNIIDIKIPPLRERRNEILPLCDHFLQKHSTAQWPLLEITPILRQVLMEYSWPGNVRELENAMRKYLVLRSPSILAAEIRERTVRAKTVYVPGHEPAERRAIAEVPVEAAFARRGADQSGWGFHGGSHTATRPVPRRDTLHAHEKTAIPMPATPIPISAGSASALAKVNEARRAAEAQAIIEALNSSLWNRKRAANLLNVDYKALLYKMKKLGIGEKRTVSAS